MLRNIALGTGLLIAGLIALAISLDGRSATSRTSEQPGRGSASPSAGAAVAERSDRSPELEQLAQVRAIVEDGGELSSLDLGGLPLPKSVYVVAMNYLYTDYTLTTLDEFGAGDMSPAELDEALERNDAFVDQLERITPPAEVAAAHETFIDVYRAVPDIARAMESGIGSGPTDAGEVATMIGLGVKLLPLSRRIEQAQDQYDELDYVIIPFTMSELADDAKDAAWDAVLGEADEQLDEG